jgi:thiol-disulfide isomerase/thioredoxin
MKVKWRVRARFHHHGTATVKLFVLLISTWIMLSAHDASASKAKSAGKADVGGLRSGEALTHSLSKERVSATLKEGYHFNLQAPHQVVFDGVPAKRISMKDKKVEFSVPKEWAEGTASFYVCDDAVTFCEIHRIQLKGKSSADPTKTDKNRWNKSSGKVDAFGFLSDSYDEALRQAVREKKLVFIFFSAIWCPGCARYEKEVFPTGEFRNLTQSFVKLKIDTDRFENFAVSERYRVRIIPSIVVADGSGRMVAQLTEFHTLDGLREMVQSVMADPTPIAALAPVGPAFNPTKVLMLGKRLLAAGQMDLAIQYLSHVAPAPLELTIAQIESARRNYVSDPKTLPLYRERLREAIRKRPQSLRSLEWRIALLPLLEPKSFEVKQVLKEGSELVELFLRDPGKLAEEARQGPPGEFIGYEKLFVAIQAAELASTAGEPIDSVSSAWRRAAEISASYSHSDSALGFAKRRLLILIRAAKWQEAEKLADRILKAEPQLLDVKRQKVIALSEQGKYEEALRLGEEVLPQVDGRYQFQLAESLAKAHLKTGNKTAAKKILMGFLAKPEADSPRMNAVTNSMRELLKQADER